MAANSQRAGLATREKTLILNPCLKVTGSRVRLPDRGTVRGIRWPKSRLYVRNSRLHFRVGSPKQGEKHKDYRI